MAGRADLEAVLKLNDKMSATLKKIERGVDRFGKTSKRSMDKTNNSIDKVVKSFTKLAVGIGVALAVVGSLRMLSRAIGAVIDASSESERALQKMKGALFATHNAIGMTSGELIAMARRLSNLTGVQDELILSAQAIGLTFTQIGKDVFPRMMAIALDMGALFGQDLKASMIQLGKAMNDPITGASALKEVGISFSKVQIEMIRNFMEMNDIVGAQTVMLDELELEIGGVAEIMGKTFLGRINRARNAWGDFLETLGQTFTANPQVLGFLSGLEFVLKRFTEDIQMDEFQERLSTFIVDATLWINRFVLSILSIPESIGVVLSGIVQSFAGFLIQLLNILEPQLKILELMVPELADAIRSAFEDTADSLVAWSAGVEMATFKVEGLKRGVEDTLTTLALWAGLGELPVSVPEPIPLPKIDPIRTLMETLLGQLATFWSDEFQKGMGNAIGNALATGGDVMSAIGQTLAQTISTGIQNATGGVFGQLASSIGPFATAFLGPLVGGLVGGLFGGKKKKAPAVQPVRVVNFEDLTGELLRASARRRIGPPQINSPGGASLAHALAGEVRF